MREFAVGVRTGSYARDVSTHSALALRLCLLAVHETGEVIYGMLNMVDLAGSERLKKSESDGQRLKEALHINSSLSAVGKVVMSLDPESGYNYIPYRDSKLTRLLQNSIGASVTPTVAH